MKFWDASAIIPLCVKESPTPVVRKLTEEDGALVVWWTTPVECYSAFARRRRDDILTRTHEDHARQAVARLAADWTEVQPSHQVREVAGRVLLLHPLRGADALQLAAALVWAGGRAARHEFVCLDRRLREAAQREGFAVLP
ncbi:MAG: hypothetical protein AUI83_21660 [Armatimonadetes bacterium 13_1_40CM_3_65_7]|nr:MAG: hypothetical protein AUI83_21660 [Armatimonadetes bacterium 13_1_40CM_3_65_7]